MKKIPVTLFLLLLPLLSYAQNFQASEEASPYYQEEVWESAQLSSYPQNQNGEMYTPCRNADGEIIWYPFIPGGERPEIPPPGAIVKNDDYPEQTIVPQKAPSYVVATNATNETCRYHHASLVFRVADYIPLSGKMRRIYANGMPFYQIEGSYSYNGPVSAWLNVGYLSHSGRSIGERDRTYFHMLPIGFGLKYSFFLPYCWEGYIGAGPSYTFLRIHDHSDRNQHIKRGTLGGVAKVGATYQFWKCVQLDLFVDYFYTKFHFSGNRNCIRRSDLDASGVSVGAGIGFLF